MTTSIHDDDNIVEYSTDPELIYEKYKNQVDIVIDGGYGNLVPSTIIDCSKVEIDIIRQGLGNLKHAALNTFVSSLISHGSVCVK